MRIVHLARDFVLPIGPGQVRTWPKGWSGALSGELIAAAQAAGALEGAPAPDPNAGRRAGELPLGRGGKRRAAQR